MIVQVFGKVISVGEHSIDLQAGDLVYEILVPSSVIAHYKANLKTSDELSEEAESFYTIQYIEGSTGRGNQFIRLVGFKRKIEREFFRLYTSVEGIGYRTALKSLILPIHKISLAIENSDAATLKKLPHIGGRTAGKMIATLKGRMQRFTLDVTDQPLSVHPESDLHLEAIQVLKQVGYGRSEASTLIENVLQKNAKIKTAEELIQEIFRAQNQNKAGHP